MQVTGKIERPLSGQLKTPLSLFTALAAACIVGVLLVSSLWRTPGPNPAAGVSGAAQSPTPTLIPSATPLALSASQPGIMESINIPADTSDEQARALILKKVDEVLQQGVPSGVMIQIIESGQPLRILLFGRGMQPNLEPFPILVPMATPIPMEGLTTVLPADIATPADIAPGNMEAPAVPMIVTVTPVPTSK